ncbi:CocE/NonD family hydrolase [Streptomyces sp. PT12]|uniref:CocE/NonD family hydrolase n=1 Tax=Streptomyces sp. PT12 TaxID=1510197 RepID=UPI000DE1E401|nr:CocE/NonD family hydrolase [Streptomyces sp. PT12]RBM06859.1 peptidase S15 [Streptomyces sp. PT12]
MTPGTVAIDGSAIDGLATDVRLPDGRGPFPAVLIRTPYDRRRHHAELAGWARRGFAALAQDVRGRHSSAGRWRPYENEAADGAATARWIRRQPWHDGRLVAAGASYAGHCALALALEAPEGARPDAVIVAVPALGAAETAREPSGVERLASRAGWWAAHGDRRDSDEGALRKALAADPGLLAHLPVRGLPARLGRSLPSWPGLWRHRERGRIGARARQGEQPLLVVGGQHDHFAAETFALWHGWGGPSARLLMGPWGHGLVAEPGRDACPEHRVPLGDLYARWARLALTGELRNGRHGVVALGGSPLWVAADAEGEPYRPDVRVLHGASFTADPQRPVSSEELAVPTEGAPDRCLLVTTALPRPLDVIGPAEVRLRATADTPCADWFARLAAINPEGTAERLAVGVVRRADPPGRAAEFTVPLGRLARRLPTGTRLRLEIAGHHFPAHARNPHTGDDPVLATRLRASRREVEADGVALRLPVLPSRPEPVDPVQEIPR